MVRLMKFLIMMITVIKNQQQKIQVSPGLQEGLLHQQVWFLFLLLPRKPEALPKGDILQLSTIETSFSQLFMEQKLTAKMGARLVGHADDLDMAANTALQAMLLVSAMSVLLLLLLLLLLLQLLLLLLLLLLFGSWSWLLL